MGEDVEWVWVWVWEWCWCGVGVLVHGQGLWAVTYSSCIMSTMQVTLALADVHGSLSFINNTMLDSGALSMASFGQLRLHRGAALLFEGNVGR